MSPEAVARLLDLLYACLRPASAQPAQPKPETPSMSRTARLLLETIKSAERPKEEKSKEAAREEKSKEANRGDKPDPVALPVYIFDGEDQSMSNAITFLEGSDRLPHYEFGDT